MTILKTLSLSKTFKLKGLSIKAVENLEIEIERGDFFALVGESGSGKSTVARLILRLISPDSGTVFFKDNDLSKASKEELKSFRKAVGVVFQDPYSSLNPRMRVSNIVEEPIRIHNSHPDREAKLKVIETLKNLGIDESLIMRYPHQLSGGQRQRVAIARALILDPEILIADEPLSALDISLQATIINQLIEIRKRRDLAILLITHDLNIVRSVSNRVAVMHLGRVVEYGKTEDIFKNPLHPYTKILLDSIPGYHRRGREKIPKVSTEDRLAWTLKGCRFYNRCPKRMAICENTIPELKFVDGISVRCFLY